jgi:lipopolysaccharide transport system ATP-binding protein
MSNEGMAGFCQIPPRLSPLPGAQFPGRRQQCAGQRKILEAASADAIWPPATRHVHAKTGLGRRRRNIRPLPADRAPRSENPRRTGMNETVINVEGLGKRYLLRHQQEGRRYKALRDVIAGRAKALVSRKPETGNRKSTEEFWALRDVSFAVQRGDVVGIVGRNGAGKSTLLKLLSRITEPTAGRIRIRGRVASLLEVGTGFHPELTGRENVFLNGAILGMTKAEITKKFDEIVAFAEVEKFLDTPVKRYSSGMYMRLAFAVAAHLEPEILIVDEVLAVGDAAFQKKCLGKMQDVSKGGRTVLFVSHNIDAIIRLCSKVIWLNKGNLLEHGDTHSVIGHYTSTKADQPAKIEFFKRSPNRAANRNVVLVCVEWPQSSQHTPWTIPYGENIVFAVTVECRKPVASVELGLALYAPTGTEIASSSSISTHPHIELRPGIYKFHVTYDSLNLVPNYYNFGIGLKSEFGTEDYYPDGFALDVVQSPKSSTSKADTFLGYIVPEVHYELSKDYAPS